MSVWLAGEGGEFGPFLSAALVDVLTGMNWCYAKYLWAWRATKSRASRRGTLALAEGLQREPCQWSGKPPPRPAPCCADAASCRSDQASGEKSAPSTGKLFWFAGYSEENERARARVQYSGGLKNRDSDFARIVMSLPAYSMLAQPYDKNIFSNLVRHVLRQFCGIYQSSTA